MMFRENTECTIDTNSFLNETSSKVMAFDVKE